MMDAFALGLFAAVCLVWALIIAALIYGEWSVDAKSHQH